MDRKGLLADVMVVLNDAKIPTRSCNARVRNDRASIKLSVEIVHKQQLEDLVADFVEAGTFQHPAGVHVHVASHSLEKWCVGRHFDGGRGATAEVGIQLVQKDPDPDSVPTKVTRRSGVRPLSRALGGAQRFVHRLGL